jgi:hypothetical protein
LPGADMNLANWDSALFKSVPVDKDGEVSVQFRAELFNLFNGVQFGYPNASQGASDF